MKKLPAFLLALALCLCLAACGGGSQSASTDALIAEAIPEEPAIPQMNGLYETDPDENGFIYQLEFKPDGTGFYSLLDKNLDTIDDMPFSWTDTNLYLNQVTDRGQRYELDGDTVTVHFDWFEEESPTVFHRVELPPEVGIYSHIYEGETEGEAERCEFFVEFYRNHTGTLYMQDILPFNWSDGVLYYEDGTEAYRYTLDEAGNLHLHKDYADSAYDEEFYPRDYGPSWEEIEEFTLGDLEKSWALEYYVIEGENTLHYAEDEEVFCYLDWQTTSAGVPCFHFHWENAGGYMDVPELEYDFKEGALDENYRSAWYVNLYGNGVVKDRHTEERLYKVVPVYENGTEIQWNRMYALVLSESTILLRVEDYVDGLEEPIVTNMFMTEAMG